MFYDTFVQLVLLGISNFFFLQFFQVKTTASIFFFFKAKAVAGYGSSGEWLRDKKLKFQ